jgi:hypothetical protein
MFGFKIIAQYEKGIVFRFGRALPGIREAGLTWANPFTSRLRKVNMQIAVAAVPGQEYPPSRCHWGLGAVPACQRSSVGVLLRTPAALHSRVRRMCDRVRSFVVQVPGNRIGGEDGGGLAARRKGS